MIKKYLIVILALAATSPSFAQQSCSDLFSSSQRVLPRPSEDAIHLAILELYELRKQMHDKTKSNLAKMMYAEKENELQMYISKEEIRERIRNVRPKEKVKSLEEKIVRNKSIDQMIKVDEFFQRYASELLPWTVGINKPVLAISNPIQHALMLRHFDIMEMLILVYRDYYREYLEPKDESIESKIVAKNFKRVLDINNITFGRTALQRAYSSGELKIVGQLLEAGASPLITSNNNKTLLEIIITNEEIENFSLVTSKIKDPLIIKELKKEIEEKLHPLAIKYNSHEMANRLKEYASRPIIIERPQIQPQKKKGFFDSLRNMFRRSGVQTNE